MTLVLLVHVLVLVVVERQLERVATVRHCVRHSEYGMRLSVGPNAAQRVMGAVVDFQRIGLGGGGGGGVNGRRWQCGRDERRDLVVLVVAAFIAGRSEQRRRRWVLGRRRQQLDPVGNQRLAGLSQS